MAKLSHIEDVERRREQEAAQEVSVSQRDANVDDAPETQQSARAQTASEHDEQFHGIDAGAPMSGGHKFLVILAVLVTLVAILYIVNSWLHFI